MPTFTRDSAKCLSEPRPPRRNLKRILAEIHDQWPARRLPAGLVDRVLHGGEVNRPVLAAQSIEITTDVEVEDLDSTQPTFISCSRSLGKAERYAENLVSLEPSSSEARVMLQRTSTASSAIKLS